MPSFTRPAEPRCTPRSSAAPALTAPSWPRCSGGFRPATCSWSRGSIGWPPLDAGSAQHSRCNRQCWRGYQVLGRRLGGHHDPHGRLMVTELGGLAEFERELILARTTRILIDERCRDTGPGLMAAAPVISSAVCRQPRGDRGTLEHGIPIAGAHRRHEEHLTNMRTAAPDAAPSFELATFNTVHNLIDAVADFRRGLVAFRLPTKQ